VENPERKTGYTGPWNVEDSLELYGVNAWGNRYFGINAAGHAIVRPDWTEGREIDLHEVVTGGNLDRVHIGLDFFDASINRVAAWVIGARNVLRAALIALLEPIEQLRKLESEGDYTARLAVLEESKGLPWPAVWDYFCMQQNVPVGIKFLDEVKAYESSILSQRG